MQGAPIAFVDTETTGLEDRRHEVWEIAVITRDYSTGADAKPVNSYTDTEYLWRVHPNLKRADPTGLRISQFYRRTVEMRWKTVDTQVGAMYQEGHVCNLAHTVKRDECDGAEHWSDPRFLSSELARMLDGRHVVGAVPDFDSRFLGRFLNRYAEAATWHYHLVDIETMAVGYLHGRDAERRRWIETLGRPPEGEPGDPLVLHPPIGLPWSSHHLSKACGIAPGAYEEHTALGDTRWVRDWWDLLTA
jgi:hypothetical protein